MEYKCFGRFFYKFQHNIKIFVKLNATILKETRAKIHFSYEAGYFAGRHSPGGHPVDRNFIEKNIFYRRTHRLTFLHRNKYFAGSWWFSFEMYLILESLPIVGAYTTLLQKKGCPSFVSSAFAYQIFNILEKLSSPCSFRFYTGFSLKIQGISTYFSSKHTLYSLSLFHVDIHQWLEEVIDIMVPFFEFLGVIWPHNGSTHVFSMWSIPKHSLKHMCSIYKFMYSSQNDFIAGISNKNDLLSI